MVPADAPAEVPARDGGRWHLWGLSIGGAVVGVGTWVAGVVNYFSTINCQGDLLEGWDCRSGSGWTMVPVIGPYLALADPATARAGNTGAVTALAVTQGLAIAMAIIGPFIPIGSARVTVTPAGIGGTF
jgi:hypothetical protein